MGYPGKRKWNAQPAASSVLRYGLAVSVAGALCLARTFLYFHLPQPFNLTIAIKAEAHE
jgi:hypothetical protein